MAPFKNKSENSFYETTPEATTNNFRRWVTHAENWSGVGLGNLKDVSLPKGAPRVFAEHSDGMKVLSNLLP